MTAITKAQRVDIQQAVVDLTRLAKSNVPKLFPIEDLIQLFWTKEEHENVKHVQRYLQSSQISKTVFLLHTGAKITVPGEDEALEIRAQLHANQSGPGVVLWPKDNHAVRADADQTALQSLADLVGGLVQAEVDGQLLSKVTTYLLDECKTHEQIRYTFPPYLRILRQAGLGGVADIVGTVKRAQAPVHMDNTMRQTLKHMIHWCTVQELLCNFDEKDKDVSHTMATIDISSLSRDF